MHSKLPEHLLEFSRSLRLHQTDAESLLWLLLRNRSLGYKFRRQHPVGKYILDFYCHEAHLAVELDGGQHSSTVAAGKDEHRTAELCKLGIEVLRFWDHEVLKETEAVERIHQVLMERVM
jgi:very-short-patch-repair endonuclease